jgi:hypothetical protein
MTPLILEKKYTEIGKQTLSPGPTQVFSNNHCSERKLFSFAEIHRQLVLILNYGNRQMALRKLNSPGVTTPVSKFLFPRAPSWVPNFSFSEHKREATSECGLPRFPSTTMLSENDHDAQHAIHACASPNTQQKPIFLVKTFKIIVSLVHESKYVGITQARSSGQD